MATVFGIFSETVQDAQANKASHFIEVSIDDTSTVAQLVTAFKQWQDRVDDLQGVFAVEGRIEIKALADTIKTTADAGADVNQTGTLSLSQAGTVTDKVSVLTPGWKDGLIVGRHLDMTSSLVTDYADWLTAAHFGIQAVSRAHNNMVALLSGRLSFRGLRGATSSVEPFVP